MTFPEQAQPVISTPEELLERGEMPQIPYVKTARVPEGFESLEHGLVAYLRDRVEGEISSRTLTMHAGKVTFEVDDPDVPRVPDCRTGLFAVALTEGGDPLFWVWAFQEASDLGVIVSEFLDEDTARAEYKAATDE